MLDILFLRSPLRRWPARYSVNSIHRSIGKVFLKAPQAGPKLIPLPMPRPSSNNSSIAFRTLHPLRLTPNPLFINVPNRHTQLLRPPLLNPSTHTGRRTVTVAPSPHRARLLANTIDNLPNPRRRLGLLCLLALDNLRTQVASRSRLVPINKGYLRPPLQ